MKGFAAILLSVVLLSVAVPAQGQETDKDRLGMAIDYFQAAKYHEALLIFRQLDKDYELNPRIKAYMGVCHYYEWEYEEAVAILDPLLDQLEAFAPHERSVYYYSDAESHFQLGHYERAIPPYERTLNVCHADERGDILYRLGFCYLYQDDKPNAMEYFSSALAYYIAFPSDQRRQQTAQLKHMIAGLAQDL